MLRVLFVDDEPMILESLRNAFRRQRTRWDMVFVASGAAALEALAAGHFDVVVTDMRMPGMDGAELLLRIRDAHPATMRVILSGDAERDDTLRALSAAHQYLSKPCDTEVLRATIERISALAALLSDPTLRDVVGRLDKLPSLPRSFAALTQVLASPVASIADVSRVLSRDAAMAVKILQVANSAFFGPVQQKTSLATAVAYLGLDLVKALALTAHVFAALEGHRLSAYSLETFQRSSILAARLASRLIQDPKQAEVAFTAALVHDVGQVVLALGMTDQYAEVLWLARDGDLPLHLAELYTLKVDHPAVGAYLLGVWGLPLSIVELTAHHHAGDRPPRSPLQAAVQVASALAGEALGGDAALYAGPIDPRCVEALGQADTLVTWRALAQAEASQLLRELAPG